MGGGRDMRKIVKGLKGAGAENPKGLKPAHEDPFRYVVDLASIVSELTVIDLL